MKRFIKYLLIILQAGVQYYIDWTFRDGKEIEKEKIFCHTSWLIFSGLPKMDSSRLGFPVVTETYLPSCSSQQYGWNSRSSTPCHSFSVSSFGWRRASSKKLDVWLQGHRVSQTDCAELILWHFFKCFIFPSQRLLFNGKGFFYGKFLFVCFAQT